MHIIDFLQSNWKILSVFFSALAAVATYLYTQITATRAGIRALLRADIIRLYNKYHDDLGYCPIYVKEALEDEYKQYHALKGNGVVTKLYKVLMDVPTEPLDKEKK